MLIAANVSPLQGWDCFLDTLTRGFTPGYHMSGFQPAEKSELQTLGSNNLFENFTFQFADSIGLKARDVIAQAEGLGKSSHKIHQAL